MTELPVKSASVKIAAVKLDKPYPAMEGPNPHVILPLPPSLKAPFIWVTGFKIDVTDKGRPAPQFLCHSRFGTVTSDVKLGSIRSISREVGPGVRFLASLSQGQTEMEFPAGFALRVPLPAGRQDLIFGAQLQNPEGKSPKNLDVSGMIRYLDGEAGADAGLRPLQVTKLAVTQATPLKADSHSHTHHAHADETGMFMVPPGRHRYSTDAKLPMPAGKDKGVVHYIRVHLHAHATSIEIVDVTTGKSLWKGVARTNSATASLEHTDHYESQTGFPIFADRSYRLVAEYDNPTAKPVDAMAFTSIYYE